MSLEAYPLKNTRRESFRMERWSWAMRGWLLFALILAGLLHWWMYHYFNNVTFTSRAALAHLEKPKERIALDPRVLQERPAVQEIPDIIAPKEEVKAPDIKADLADIVDLLPDNKEIDLTPKVDQVTNFKNDHEGMKQMAAQAPALAPIAEAMPDDQVQVAEAAMALKSSILKEAVSSQQLMVPTQALDKQLDGINEKLLDMAQSSGEAGNGAPAKVPGYSNLDELLGGGKGLTSSTDPILLPTDLLFDYGSAELAEGARLSLMKLGYLIQRNPNHRFVIEGHTDSFGGDAYNLELSQRRAEAVVTWLVESLHLPVDRIQAVGRGRTALLQFGGTVEEQAINRRVEIKVRPIE